MTQLLIAIVIMVLACGGLALGLMFGRGPVKTSCGGMECLPGPRCHDCPNRKDRP
ncbi:hypothetical protein [Paracoccus sp. (in: a-proteobacteria)]|uniref:hypothetical protein n=1 Tax=Paracoccus sp. TaxID=267 RepID=UPI0026DFF104|nr:hypothetical protein [Paracoccus sp. (in: a-proteobacteria)]MDO5647083.1 hypothetical protein [Paracoccus sp. (in: a-proteobacteria)]